MSLLFSRTISWEKIWERWRQDEIGLWEDYYRTIGYESWQTWRYETLVKPLGADTWDWELFQIQSPLTDVPKMFVGPFKGWRTFYGDRENSRFADIVAWPGFQGSQTQEKIRSIVEGFPQDVQFMGVTYDDQVMIGEGTHRACALAQAAHDGRGVETVVTIALARIDKDSWDRHLSNYMKLTSSAFNHQSIIPVRYTRQGENLSPPLTIEHVPDGAKSLILFIVDPDVPKSIREDGTWNHWVVWNIPALTREIAEGEVPGVVGLSTREENVYGGMNPPDGEHRYFFYLHALDVVLDLPTASTKADVLAAAEGHILDTAQLMGRYTKL